MSLEMLPEDGLKVPAWQDKQEDWPVEGWYLPGAQATQLDSEFDPSAELYLPERQALHTVEPEELQ